MFQKAREFEQEMESRFQDAVLRVEKEQQATLQELDANYRAELESMQEQFMGQLDEIEVNAQVCIQMIYVLFLSPCALFFFFFFLNLSFIRLILKK